jgi:hypothetical protein
MEYDYTHLNHNSLMSQKKLVIKGVILKGAYYTLLSFSLCVKFHQIAKHKNK